MTHVFEAFEGGPSITTFGSVGLVSLPSDQEGATIGPGKPLAVLVYLTASPGRCASREHLIDLLWADAEPEAARHGVRQTVWMLRRKLGSEAIVATRDLLCLTTGIGTDRDLFLQAIEAQAYDEAVAIYHGDFLPGMAMPGGLRFEQWAEIERQRLRSMFLRAAESEVRRYVSQSRHREAIALARRLRNTDPDAEASWRLLIETLLGFGDHLAAASEADGLARRIAAEQREPEPATQAVIRAAQSSASGTGASVKPRGLSAELIGRAEEFAVLTSAWDDARTGRAVHVHITALPGVGKTRLVGDFAARLRARRVRTVLISLRQGDHAVPYAGLGELAAALAHLPGAGGISPASARTLVALNPELSAVYVPEADVSQVEDVTLRRAVAMYELIAAVSDETALAVIIDDLHWIDDASERALTSALQRLSNQRVLVVTAARPSHGGFRTAAMIQIWLRPLSEQHVAGLVVSLGALPDEPWAEPFPEQLHAATDGVPLLVLETLQLLVERRVLKLADSTWSSPRPDQLEKVLETRTALTDRLRTLSDVERRVLTTIAAAGTPVAEDMLTTLLHMGRTELDANVGGLEERGLLVSNGDGWRVAHDSIGEVATKLAGEEALRETHRELGAWFFSTAGNDSGAWMRASSHFALARDIEAVTRCFLNWLALTRRRGDPRHTAELATEFVGEQAAIVGPSTLVRAAPLHLRLAKRRGIVIVAASLLVAASAIAFDLRSSPTTAPPDATIYAYSADSTMHVNAALVDLRESDLGRTDLIELQNGRATRPIALPDPLNTTLSPDGRSWASRRIFADSGGLDLVITDVRSGNERRLTDAPGDDYAPAWSPDGRQIVFSTARFSARSHVDLAIVDVHSGIVRQLTHGPESDETPQWHPSGTEIAFTRRDWSTGHYKICLITVDASRVDCSVYESTAGMSVRGWYDWRRLVVIMTAPSVSDSATVALIDVENHEVRPLLSGRIGSAQLSPDARWIACLRASNPQLPLRWIVFPVSKPELAREVVADRVGERELSLVWLGRRPAAAYLSKLTIRTPAGTLPLAVGTQLVAAAVDDSGRARVPSPLAWTSLTPAIATVDSASGLLVPRAAGMARVRVSAGGWIAADTSVRIGDGVSPLVLSEDWTKGLSAQFVPFGVPAPAVIGATPVGIAMRNNGDGSFVSGVYTRKELAGSAGIGVEATVSTPIDSLQWQSLSIELRPGMDSARLALWDHREGPIPASEDPGAVGRCDFGIPGGEGRENSGTISLLDGRQRRMPLDQRYFSGRPYHVLVQLLPDGRCGLAIDGKPLMIVSGLPIDNARYRLVISGNSMQTDILVGGIRVWTGVRSDIPWIDLDLHPSNGSAR